MRLADFIRHNLEMLLEEWDAAADVIIGDKTGLDRQALRDHAGEMLRFVADNIEEVQTEVQRLAKSRGGGESGQHTAAGRHGVNRMKLGLTLTELVTEHRALRASITKRWTQEQGGLETDDIDELIRFNEAMDELLSESVQSYSAAKARQTRLFEAMLASTPDLTYVFDLDGNFRYANAATAEVLRTSPRALVGRNVAELDQPQAEELRERIREVARQRVSHRGEVTVRTAGDREAIYEYVLAPVLDQQGNVEAVAGASRDVTERKAAEQKSWQDANFDCLTGIPNRRLFFDRLVQGLRESERHGTQLGLLFIDLDRFKPANDRLGHDGGDEILRQVAARLGACVRRSDSVARLGGDEFLVLLKDLDAPEEVARVAEQILAELARPLAIRGETVRLSGSLGVAVYPRDGRAVHELVRHADLAMYAAKAAGGNRVAFHAEERHSPDREPDA